MTEGELVAADAGRALVCIPPLPICVEGIPVGAGPRGSAPLLAHPTRALRHGWMRPRAKTMYFAAENLSNMMRKRALANLSIREIREHSSANGLGSIVIGG